MTSWRGFRPAAWCNKCDVYVTYKGKVLKRNEELRSCGVSDGCTVQVIDRKRGGGKYRNKKNKAEKKTTASPKGQEPVRGQQKHNEENIILNLLSCEDAENEVIRHFEENEETRKMRDWQRKLTVIWKGGYKSTRR